ncbi:MAG: hypothetical protein MJ002_02090 [Paludibacteraceae bacterium]|nr:hypothetical protein [Paludibacteraceae bacterium]
MRCYAFCSVDDKFTFGKYRDLMLGDVIEMNPEYIYWCVANVDITFSEDCIMEIQEMYPDFIISKSFDAKIHCGESFDEVFYEDDNDYCSCNEDWHDNWQDDWYEEPTYDRYGGSYAQDVMGYSDDDIDTIFDGDPDAYWNID